MSPSPTDRRTAARSDSPARRTLTRLRDLCDEVLASHRVATGTDPVTAEDRAAAETVLATVGPRRKSA